jgi:hypothetical protein
MVFVSAIPALPAPFMIRSLKESQDYAGIICKRRANRGFFLVFGAKAALSTIKGWESALSANAGRGAGLYPN